MLGKADFFILFTMLKFPSKLALAASALLAMAFTFSCSGGDDDGGNDHKQVLKKEKISGVSQKGPFSEGAIVKICELDANLDKTSKCSEGATDGDGNYDIAIKDGQLASQFVSIEVSGKYANEVSGEESDGSITLSAVANVLAKDTVNINVLTHLEYENVIKLAKITKKFDDAKKDVQKEVLNALGISASKNSEDLSIFSDSTLLAVSVLLQGNRTAKELSGLLAKLSKEIRGNGVLSASTKAEVASGFDGVNMDKVGENLPGAKVPSQNYIEKIIVNINSSTKLSSSSGKGGSSSSVQLEACVQGTVTIGDQVWQKCNLNYDIGKSKCYEDDPTNCNIYGRLYDWATAMALPASCNSSSCSGQIQPKHQGICPGGWHIPSNEDWDKLLRYVDGTSGTDSPYISYTAGRYLKARNGWNGNGNGEDTYGFSALPGGYGYLDGYFDFVGSNGFWWSASEGNSSGAYYQRIYNNSERIQWFNNNEDILFSVRCIQDQD